MVVISDYVLNFEFSTVNCRSTVPSLRLYYSITTREMLPIKTNILHLRSMGLDVCGCRRKYTYFGPTCCTIIKSVYFAVVE